MFAVGAIKAGRTLANVLSQAVDARSSILAWVGDALINVLQMNIDLYKIYLQFENISVYMDKHHHVSLNTKDYFVKQISHLSKSVIIVASV